jgi:thioredoxin reductase
MESLFIWAITVFVVALIFIPYILNFRKRQKLDVERKKEAKSLGIDRPKAQYPLIDDSLCIGCGSCVDACPEGDVLGIVFGKATIINGLRCVGHALCEPVCPVGAIKVGLGDITTRPDIPILSPANETTVPGLYIAGELGGLSLIRNAVSQGKLVVDTIARDLQSFGNNEVKDVAIVGAGPAGMSAALTAIQHGLSYLVMDQQDPGGTILQYPRRKLVMTQKIEIPLYGWLDRDEYSKEVLLEIWQNIIQRFGINIFTNHKVESVQKLNGYFEVCTNGGNVRVKRVVLAMGRRGIPRKLGVNGEHQPKVMYQLIDAKSYENCNILVVGGGDSAVEAAIGLAQQKGNNVAISYRKNKFFRIKKKNQDRIDDLIRRKKVIPYFNSQVLEIKEKSVVMIVEEDRIEFPNDYIFVYIGGIPPFQFLKELGVEFGGEVRKIA